MYNTDMPTRAELPTSQQLTRSTAIAFITAGVLLVTVVMPADYGIDPTGIGRLLKLTQMGEIKRQLAADAAADTAAAKPAFTDPPVVAQAAAVQPAAKAVPVETVAAPVQAPQPKLQWRDETPFTLKPGEGTEIKLKMVEGGKAQYVWVVKGGAVNFDTHGDATLKSISYEKGRGVASKEGVLVAAFTGNHGWYWRNRGQSDVQVILRTRGDYSELKR